jgi:hypothetical protein
MIERSLTTDHILRPKGLDVMCWVKASTAISCADDRKRVAVAMTVTVGREAPGNGSSSNLLGTSLKPPPQGSCYLNVPPCCPSVRITPYMVQYSVLLDKKEGAIQHISHPPSTVIRKSLSSYCTPYLHTVRQQSRLCTPYAGKQLHRKQGTRLITCFLRSSVS